MSANDLLQWLSWLLYLVIFAYVVAAALRRRTRAQIDMVLFFGATTAIIVLSTLEATTGIVPPLWASDVTGILLLALPYLLLRLVSDFSSVPRWVMVSTAVGLALSVVAVVALPTPMPTTPALLLVAYFSVVTAYNAWSFVRQAGRTHGVTRRRMQSIAIGTVCVGLVLVIAAASIVGPAYADLWMALSQLAGLASGVAYFAGFAPPTLLRRAWQEPELRAALNRAARLPHLPDTRSIVTTLEASTAASLGAQAATVGLWDSASGTLRFYYKAPPASSDEIRGPSQEAAGLHGDVWELEPRTRSIYGRAFLEQRGVFISNVQRADPDNAELSRMYGARSALAAPISAGDKRLGVLVVYAPQEPLFADSDLELLQLLCDQAAVILESRALIDEATRIQAREEALRLKEDFISSAAHQVKTPLTGILTQTQLLQRYADREPVPRTHLAGLERIVGESRRLTRVLLELFDAAQLEPGAATLHRESVDLAELSRQVASARPRCRVEAPLPVVASVDRARMSQMLEHMIGNALMYDPSRGEVVTRVWQVGDTAHISVEDHGIGITPEDLPHIFDRFQRGRNVDDRRHAGLGLGLYVSRQIAEQHGGRISVRSRPATGTVFEVELPIVSPDSATSANDEDIARPAGSDYGHA